MDFVGMNKPELYHAANEKQRTAILTLLKEYSPKIKWRKNDTAVDIGCGDGSVSVINKNFAPYGYKKYVACDISETMLKFASTRYADENMSFRVLDLAGEVPDDMVGEFNHVFCFYLLHWIRDHEKAFSNMHKLLSDGGDCLVGFIGHTPIYSVYAILAKHPKWKSWLKHVDRFISPYQESENPEKILEDIVKKCGYKNVDVKMKLLTNVYTAEAHKNTVRSVEPFDMPNDVFDDFMEDYMKVAQETGVMNITTDEKTGKPNVTFDYKFLVIHANK